MGLAFHRAVETEVGAMAGIGIFATRAARLAARNGGFGQRSTAHGFRFRQFSSEFAKACGGSWIVHALALRLYKPKGKAKKISELRKSHSGDVRPEESFNLHPRPISV